MPETPDTTALVIADHILDAAADIEHHGLWACGPNFVAPLTGRLDVPAAVCKATTGYLPFLFTIQTVEAADAARAYIEANPAAMAVLWTIAAHMATLRPDADWTDDPIERLSAWPHLLGVDPAEIPQTLRDIAHTLTVTATAAAPAAPVAA